MRKGQDTFQSCVPPHALPISTLSEVTEIVLTHLLPYPALEICAVADIVGYCSL